MTQACSPSRRVDLPQPGCFEMRLVRGGPLVACKLTLEDGVWQAWIDGAAQRPAHADPAQARGVFRVWHSGVAVDEAAYRFRLAKKLWAQDNDPTHPSLNPGRPINLHARRSVF